MYDFIWNFEVLRILISYWCDTSNVKGKLFILRLYSPLLGVRGLRGF